jgi:hypothetical protein
VLYIEQHESYEYNIPLFSQIPPMPATRQTTARRATGYKCDYCSTEFPTRRGYNVHLNTDGGCAGEHRVTVAGAEAAGGEMDFGQELVDAEIVNNLFDDDGINATDVPMWGNSDTAEQDEPLAHERIRGTETFVEHYPVATAGAPIRPATEQELNRLRQSHENVGPLSDPEVFEVAELLITSGMSGKKRSKLLKLERVSCFTSHSTSTHIQNQFQGICPWNNNREMVLDIDKHLPRGSKWCIKTIKAAGSNGCEYGQLWMRNTFTGVSNLCEDPSFKGVIQWRPTREWTSPACEVRKYGETTSSNRMWDLQVGILACFGMMVDSRL